MLMSLATHHYTPEHTIYIEGAFATVGELGGGGGGGAVRTLSRVLGIYSSVHGVSSTREEIEDQLDDFVFVCWITLRHEDCKSSECGWGECVCIQHVCLFQKPDKGKGTRALVAVGEWVILDHEVEKMCRLLLDGSRKLFVVFCNARLVYHIAIKNVASQGLRRPLAKHNSLSRIGAIPHSENDIEGIEANWLIGICNVQFLHIAFFVYLLAFNILPTCFVTTVLSIPKMSAICACVAHTVSCEKSPRSKMAPFFA